MQLASIISLLLAATAATASPSPAIEKRQTPAPGTVRLDFYRNDPGCNNGSPVVGTVTIDRAKVGTNCFNASDVGTVPTHTSFKYFANSAPYKLKVFSDLACHEGQSFVIPSTTFPGQTNNCANNVFKSGKFIL